MASTVIDFSNRTITLEQMGEPVQQPTNVVAPMNRQELYLFGKAFGAVGKLLLHPQINEKRTAQGKTVRYFKKCWMVSRVDCALTLVRQRYLDLYESLDEVMQNEFDMETDIDKSTVMNIYGTSGVGKTQFGYYMILKFMGNAKHSNDPKGIIYSEINEASQSNPEAQMVLNFLPEKYYSQGLDVQFREVNGFYVSRKFKTTETICKDLIGYLLEHNANFLKIIDVKTNNLMSISTIADSFDNETLGNLRYGLVVIYTGTTTIVKQNISRLSYFIPPWTKVELEDLTELIEKDDVTRFLLTQSTLISSIQGLKASIDSQKKFSADYDIFVELLSYFKIDVILELFEGVFGALCDKIQGKEAENMNRKKMAEILKFKMDISGGSLRGLLTDDMMWSRVTVRALKKLIENPNASFEKLVLLFKQDGEPACTYYLSNLLENGDLVWSSDYLRVIYICCGVTAKINKKWEKCKNITNGLKLEQIYFELFSLSNVTVPFKMRKLKDKMEAYDALVILDLKYCLLGGVHSINALSSALKPKLKPNTYYCLGFNFPAIDGFIYVDKPTKHPFYDYVDKRKEPCFVFFQITYQENREINRDHVIEIMKTLNKFLKSEVKAVDFFFCHCLMERFKKFKLASFKNKESKPVSKETESQPCNNEKLEVEQYDVNDRNKERPSKKRKAGKVLYIRESPRIKRKMEETKTRKKSEDVSLEQYSIIHNQFAELKFSVDFTKIGNLNQ